MFKDEKFSVDKASNAINSSIDNSKSIIPIKMEVIAAITRVRLKLHPSENLSTIELLDSLNDLLKDSLIKKKNIEEKLLILQLEGQKLLKYEWSRTKQEVKSGQEIEKQKSKNSYIIASSNNN